MSYLGLYEGLGVRIVRPGEHEVQALCPFHGDETPSLSINVDSGLFKCFAANCGKGGTWEKFNELLQDLKVEATIDPKIIETHHHQLLNNQEALRWCYEARGLTHETIKSYQLGFEPGRIWIPIKDRLGRYVNVRRHAMDRKTKYGKTLSHGVGYGQVRLWPPEYGDGSEIWLAEGELDCLVLLQAGFNAATTTGGAGTWKPEWLASFINKTVRLVYDADEAGVHGALKAGYELLKVAKDVKRLQLNFQERVNKDITDWFVKEKKTRDDLIRLESETPVLVDPQAKPVKDTTVHTLELHQASQQDMVGKQVRVKVIVAGKDLAPFSAPKEVSFTCRMGLRICQNCSIARANGNLKTTIPGDEPALLTLINVHESQQKVNIRKMVGIVPTCPRFDYKVHSYHNLEELKLLPDLEYTPDVNTEYVIRQGYYVGDGIRTNQAYEAEGGVIPHPATQYVTFMFPKMEPTRSSIQTYKPTSESVDRLAAAFQPEQGQLLLDKWKDIAADFESNVTHIYRREDLIYAADLMFHSVLGFTFQDQPVQRGWCEGLIVGDTRCGKSESVKSLVQHYRMGEIVTGENVSYAGLVGGLQQTQKRWSITWGKIPLNDGRALVIDEVSGMSLDDIGRMSGIRSSGIAEISKIQTERTMARTRLLWVSNPRSARPLNSYDNGAVVIRELIGRPEDVARFDFCLMVSTAEVPIEVINKYQPIKLPHKYTSELCHELLLWLWSRAREDIYLSKQTIESCLDYASQFAKLYSAELPLVEPNEQRIKFARLGASVAGRFFSTDDGRTLVVKPEHVELAASLLQKWYSNSSFNYDGFSQAKLKEIDLNQEDKEIVRNMIYPFGIRFCQQLLSHNVLRSQDLEDLTGKERKDVKYITSVLVQCGALRRKSVGYVKSPGFIKLLRETRPEMIPQKPEI